MPLSAKNIVSDIMNGASEVEQFNRTGIATYLKYDRVFLVDGANQFSNARTAMVNARLLIKTLYPVGSPAPAPHDPTALARGYAAASVGSDDVIQVTLSYLYDQIALSSTQWTLEVTNFLEVVDTDSELPVYDDPLTNPGAVSVDANGNVSAGSTTGNAGPGVGAIVMAGGRVPICVKYFPDWQFSQTAPPNGGNGIWIPNALGVSQGLVPTSDDPGPPYNTKYYSHQGVPLISFAHVPVFRPRKRWVFTRTVYGDIAQKMEAAADTFEGQLNSKTFRGRPPGCVMCMNCDVMYQPYAGVNIARLEFVARPSIEGWQPWVRYSNPIWGGTPPNVFRFNMKGGAGNGIRRSYQYTAADMNQLLGILPGGVIGDSTASTIGPQGITGLTGTVAQSTGSNLFGL